MRRSGKVIVQGQELKYQWAQNRLTITSRLNDYMVFLLADNGEKQDYSRDLAYDVVNSAMEQGIISPELESRRPGIFEVVGHAIRGRLFATRDLS